MSKLHIGAVALVVLLSQLPFAANAQGIDRSGFSDFKPGTIEKLGATGVRVFDGALVVEDDTRIDILHAIPMGASAYLQYQIYEYSTDLGMLVPASVCHIVIGRLDYKSDDRDLTELERKLFASVGKHISDENATNAIVNSIQSERNYRGLYATFDTIEPSKNIPRSSFVSHGFYESAFFAVSRWTYTLIHGCNSNEGAPNGISSVKDILRLRLGYDR